MDKKFPQNYPIYDTSYGTEFPSDQYYVISFDEMPSKYEHSTKTYDKSIEQYFSSKEFLKIVDLKILNRRSEITHSVLLKNDDKKIIIELNSTDNNKDKPLFNIKIFYDFKKGDIFEQIDFNELKSFERKKEKSKHQFNKIRHGTFRY